MSPRPAEPAELPPCCAGGRPVPWRYATPHTPGRRSYGAAIAELARALGKPLMPWQLHVAYVLTELDESTGGWAYPDGGVTVQRQAGKTTLLGPLHLHRGILRPKGKTWHVDARTRQDARDTWLDVADLVETSPLSSLFDVRRSNGSEAITGPTRATLRVTPPNGDGLHGKPNDLITADEIWAYDPATGDSFLQGAYPSFTTTAGQLIWTSTAGDASSAWMRSRVDRGRAAVQLDQRSGLAFFECSIDQAGAELVAAGLDPDRDDVTRADAFDVILAAHPAAGHTLRPAALAQAADNMTPGQFLRAYGNHWTAAGERAIPEHVWQAAQLPADARIAPPEPGSMALAFAAALDRSAAAIVAAWRPDPAGPARLMVVDALPGTSWLPARLVELRDRWRPLVIGHAGAGPTLDLADAAGRAGVDVTAPKSRDYIAAHSAYLAALVDRRVEHVPSRQLDDAVAAAARREFPEGGFVWSRRHSGGSIAELEAATVAAWLLDHAPTRPGRARIVVARPQTVRRRPPAGDSTTPAGHRVPAGVVRVPHPG